MRVSWIISGTLLLFTLLKCYHAIPSKLTSCMSFMEEDGFNDSQYEDYDSEESAENSDGAAAGKNTPHRRLCPVDYTYCFALWRQPQPTTNLDGLVVISSPLIEKQGCWKESSSEKGVAPHCQKEACTNIAPTSPNSTLYFCCCAGDGCNDNVRVETTPPPPPPLASHLSPMASDGSGTVALSEQEMGDDAQAAASRRRGSSISATMTARSSLWFILSLSVVGLFAGLFLTSALLCHYREQAHAKASAAAAIAGGAGGCIVNSLEEGGLDGGAGGGLGGSGGPGYSSNLRNVDNINLVGMVGRGKYGVVWQGRLHGRSVAVKIFPEAHEAYYRNERSIYTLPLMADCPALLGYLGYDERRTMEGRAEFQLVLALAPLGCLQDWLIAHVLDAEAFARITRSVTRGLSHLHTEVRRGGVLVKPCVAHRDLNTRNILLKADRSCCIADFGFALKVFGGRYEYQGEVVAAETRSINEVGTLRYMAPELLEGAVNLRDCETSLKQMDVYALGLVLWEAAARCDDFYASSTIGQSVGGVGPPPYSAPYEAEVGPHPSFDQMQSLVVRHKARPLFPAGWGLGGEAGVAAAKLVRDTCEDCWDHDAEARLTALCTEERMHEVTALRRPPHTHHNSSAGSPLAQLSANNDLTATVPSAANEVIEAVIGCESTHGIVENGDGGERSSTGAADEVAVFNAPPNQQVPQSPLAIVGGQSVPAHMTEKNHLLGETQQRQQQAPVQPHHGRNPCLERNLVPVKVRSSPVLVERSKKHSFRHNGSGGIVDEHSSFSCLDEDVSVEELFAGGTTTAAAGRLMGKGFPKLQNADRKLRGWHGVRALIQKKLFGRNDGAPQREITERVLNGIDGPGDRDYVDYPSSSILIGRISGYGNEKCNLMDKQFVDNIATVPRRVPSSPIPSSTAAGGTRRPNNLDLSPLSTAGSNSGLDLLKSNLIHSIAEEATIPTITGSSGGRPSDNNSRENVVLRRSSTRRAGTPSHVIVPRSFSATLLQQASNNTNNLLSISPAYISAGDEKPDCVPPTTETAKQITSAITNQHRRQRSLDLFHEVFSGQKGSAERLRDPSQRVKTPGDVPPSVRRARAAKTLSLYDDRMMMGALAAMSEQELLQRQQHHNQIL